MKKIFLSLSAIALLAVGTVSCGSDDGGTPPVVTPPIVTPPDVTPPAESASKFTWSGIEYPMDVTTTGVVINAQSQMIAYNIGTEEEPMLATRWIVISHEGEGTDWQTSNNALWTQIFVPVDGQTAVYPHESEDIYLLSSEVLIEGEYVSNEDMETVTAFSIGFNVWDEDEGKINYTTSTTFPEGTVNLSFNGDMNGPLGFTLSGGKSASNLKSLIGTPLTKETVDFSSVQKIDNAKLTKIVK